jgi:glycosyltransferase involved in cell wall biosynthesis
VIPILYLQSTSEVGGSDVTLLRTIEVLDRTKVEPHVALPHDGPLVEAFRKAGCRVHLLPAMRKLTSRRGLAYLGRYAAGYVPGALAVARLIRREELALVHTNSIHNLYGFLAARWTRRPHVWHVREIVVEPRAIRWLEVRLVRRFSTHIVVMSDAVGDMFRAPGGRAPGHMIKLYDGVDLDAFHPRQRTDNRIRRELGVGEGVPLLGIVARLDPSKGVGDFLEAASLIRRDVPEARFLVCGGEIEGHEGLEASLRRQARSRGLDGAVLFSGWRYRHRDIPEVYGALDVSVQCPVHPEAYGLANVEAMASGVPSIAAAAGGPLELCVQGETTLLVPPRDPRATAEAAVTLLRDPSRRSAMGGAGRRRAERLFDRRQCVRALEELYARTLGRA